MSLKIFQSFWGMVDLPHSHSAAEEWPLATKVEQARLAGFDGIDVPLTPEFTWQEAVALTTDGGLEYGITCFPRTVDDFVRALEAYQALAVPPSYLNVQPNRRVFTADEAVEWVGSLLATATSAGVRMCVETHRDRTTTSLPLTLQLLDGLPDLRLTADLSHYVVGEEFAVWPICDEDQRLIHRIIERSDAFHGRVASREQIQIAPAWELHSDWLELFASWWEDGFRAWRKRSSPDDDLVFVCELGPPWYAIRGAGGLELSDRWEDALFLKQVAEDRWRRVSG